MPQRKKTVSRPDVAKVVRKAATKAAAAAQAGQMKEAWKATVDAYSAAEGEVERQVKDLVKKGRLSASEAKDMLQDLTVRFTKERKKAMREVEGQVKEFRHRLDKERKVVGRVVDDAVRAALAAFNIPSRGEVAELTRKVDELSRKIDSIKKPSASGRRTTRGRRVVARPSASV
jgi:poly(hydroxyalkanoate) granule-associated protein